MHLTKPVKNNDKSIIPVGLTSIPQPLNIVLNKPFKGEVRKRWIMWMSSGQVEKNATGVKTPGLAIVTIWVKDAWNYFSNTMVSKIS